MTEEDQIKIAIVGSCDQCHRTVFDPTELQDGFNLEPFDLNMGNAVKYLRMDGLIYKLCSNCRYKPPYERY